MASAQPIAGAQYHWTNALMDSCLASVININANQIQSLASLNFPEYVPTQWQTTLLMIATLTASCAFIFGSIAVNGIFAYTFITVLLYCVGDIGAVRDSPYPILQIYAQVTGSRAAATAIVTTSLMISVSVSLGNISSAGRLTWAWARDGGLPAWLAHIDSKYRIPIRALWVPIVITMLLSLINIVNYAAFQVFLSLASLALTASYILPIACMLRARLRHEVIFGDWKLGRLDVPINTFALIYSAWMCIFFCFPTYLPITGDGFNYALPIFAFVVVFALFSWLVWARKQWPGLNEEVVEAVIADSNRKTRE
ncbi:hypothetical protein M409DRAFT_23872 [Zasmidium cellare ATCC 36951]|uniref:Amino acid permease/ SLC12A domain-containing protein n=1 Tax=Zasmidium cellare ATCC 36951 TaxID=1080233 RepID=A0A6A6CHA4_ZASCE|nr:uncharacterized protein M409DRAFT_23872 [Zasmidium cellare ATCC 36951]KAF2165578.1 hypothetical protein M409DRAFT_23872 [Zasmidium cellare ATCC 36951]